MVWTNFFQGCKKHNSLLWNNFYAKQLSSPIFRWMFFQITGRLFQWRKYSRPACFPLSSVIQFLFRNIFEYFCISEDHPFSPGPLFVALCGVFGTLCAWGADRTSLWGGRENRAGEGDFPWTQPPLLSMEHFPAMTTVTGVVVVVGTCCSPEPSRITYTSLNAGNQSSLSYSP